MNVWLIGYIIMAIGTFAGVMVANKSSGPFIIIEAFLGAIVSPFLLIALCICALVKYLDT